MTKWQGSRCRAFDCDREANWDVTALPICYEHGMQVARHYEAEIVLMSARRLAEEAEHAIEVQEVKRGNREPSLVYYARIGDYIKIGYSTRLRNRLNSLRVDELLAVEPGAFDLEQQRHREFGADRMDLRRENFRPSDALLAHIAALRIQHDLPHWAKLPRTSTITTRRKETA